MNNCIDFTFKDTVKFLKKHNNYVILTHASPDGDTLGAGYALYYGLKQLGKSAEVICPEVIPSKYGYFLCETDHVNAKDTVVVAVDVADKRLLGALEQEFGNIVDLCIDHHISNVRYSKALYLDADASATCEIIYELLCALKIKFNDTIAKALYTGISTDTGCFKYSCVTAKTHIIAAKLYDYNIEADDINKVMFDTKSKKLLTLERMVLDTAEYHFDDKCMMITITADMQEKTGCSGTDLEGLTNISRCVEGVLAGVTIKQTGDHTYKASLRTYAPLNASQICQALGGGGHKNAAGASLCGSLDEVKTKILAAIKQNMEETNAGSFVTE
ncbi:MAG: bifunctional oligoribonuclease/PAP phosphatase NrnA [Clostridia bacterium]|nr:bifunctional oligoribonuclease/PAP phosphatase NrnA [Clostridia bacterium]